MAEHDLAARLVTLIGPLLGAVVGGLISMAATQMVEGRRRRHERREKLDSLRREASSAALAWIEPMRRAQTQAALLLMAATRGDVDHERLFADWPDLLGKLVDPSPSLQAVLPEGAYNAGYRIIRGVEELRPLGVRYAQESRTGRPPVDESGPRLEVIDAAITRLETDLRREFRATFE